MAVRERHEAAFRELVAASSSRLFRTALLVVGDYQPAQDLLQETLIKTYAAWPRLRDAGSAEAYARKVVVTTSISWRRRSSFHERPVEVLPEQLGADLTDLIVADADLWTQLQALPSRQRARPRSADSPPRSHRPGDRCSCGSPRARPAPPCLRIRRSYGGPVARPRPGGPTRRQQRLLRRRGGPAHLPAVHRRVPGGGPGRGGALHRARSSATADRPPAR